MAVETDYSFGDFTLPTLGESAYRTPARGPARDGPRRPIRHDAASPLTSSSPPAARVLEDRLHSEKLSELDPRRFTPTLHANLVSEILSLRREVDSKSNLVVRLEESLHHAEDENNKLNALVSTNAKDSRILKRQMHELEGGTLAALEDLAKERDQAAAHLDETKRLLLLSQKRVRGQEEDAVKTHALWELDRERWEHEKRSLDRKVHVADGRLRAIIAEVEAAQVHSYQRPPSAADDVGEAVVGERSSSRASGVRSAHSHYRTGSTTSFDAGGLQPSRLSIAINGLSRGLSLADELHFQNGDEDDFEEKEADSSHAALPEDWNQLPRLFFGQTNRQANKARKLLGLSVDDEEEPKDPLLAGATGRAEADEMMDERKPLYVDRAAQFSPPPSPTLQPQLATIYESQSEMGADSSRSSAASQISSSKLFDSQTPPKRSSVASQACQTMEQPPSPPDTPRDSEGLPFSRNYDLAPRLVEMKSSSTQTMLEVEPYLSLPAFNRDALFPEMEVPIIAIHPPKSRPHTPQNSVVLPPQTKSAACQVHIISTSRSVSVQTEEIRIDQRPVKLPAHLLPSAISSQPSSPTPESQPTRSVAPKIVLPERQEPQIPPRSSKRQFVVVPLPEEDVGSKIDSGHYSGTESSKPKRLSKPSSLLPRFPDPSACLSPSADDGDMSDDSFATREPIKKTLSKVQNSWKLVAQSANAAGDPSGSQKAGDPSRSAPDLDDESDSDLKSYEIGSRLASANVLDTRERTGMNAVQPSAAARDKEPSRPALPPIESSNPAPAQRTRSPSEPTLPTAAVSIIPPFPVPTRSSSRKIPWSASEGRSSPTPQSISFFGARQPKEYGRPPIKRPVIRKIKSAAARTGQPEADQEESSSRSRSPPPLSNTTTSPIEPSHPPLPPLPNDDINSPYRQDFPRSLNGSQQSSSTPVEVTEQISVVDAIAQTMIGEWMWKYVRRRRSFGVPEPATADFDANRSGGDSGIRHKRWVWLAPYERAVMWSSKQPTSGSALMGKSGRKLTIQSVLDVRDDTALPKGAVPMSCYGRSILILTPQRALKFTAANRERHYVWLTALSFLSHSNGGVAGLATSLAVSVASSSGASRPPPARRSSPEPSGLPPMPNAAALRRNPIRDSIRIAKSKGRPEASVPGARRNYTAPAAPSQRSLPDGSVEQQYSDHEDAAEPPLVPRFSSKHSRKRSNTGPKALPSSRSLRSFTSSLARSTTASNDGYAYYDPPRDYGSPTSADANFFDAVGTMRMEAFVQNSLPSNSQAYNAARRYQTHEARLPRSSLEEKRSEEEATTTTTAAAAAASTSSFGTAPAGTKKERGSYRTKQGRKKDMRYWGVEAEAKETGLRPAVSSADPFEGF